MFHPGSQILLLYQCSTQFPKSYYFFFLHKYCVNQPVSQILLLYQCSTQFLKSYYFTNVPLSFPNPITFFFLPKYCVNLLLQRADVMTTLCVLVPKRVVTPEYTDSVCFRVFEPSRHLGKDVRNLLSEGGGEAKYLVNVVHVYSG